MLRIDLVVNNLLSCARAYDEIRIQSDGSPWRPLIHCRDIARAFVAFMEAPKAVIHNKAINIGANEENHQVRDVADEVGKQHDDAVVVKQLDLLAQDFGRSFSEPVGYLIGVQIRALRD